MTTNTNAALVEYANPLNWDVDENGIRRVWKEPGSETPEAYNGFELAKAALSTAAQPLTQDEKENQLCMSSASCGQASTNESAFITSTQRSAGTFSASSERQSYRDSDGMPTERAVLEREWRRMKIALSATAAQPPAGWRMVPVEPTIGMCIAGDEARITQSEAAPSGVGLHAGLSGNFYGEGHEQY